MYDPNEGADIDGQAERDEAEYQRGIRETELAQQAGPPGSAAREAAYLELDRKLYEEGY